jgi:predicted metal-dependent hydrolase
MAADAPGILADVPTRARPGRPLRERSSREVVVDGAAVSVIVRESARARGARIAVGPRHPLQIVVPVGTSDAEVDRLLAARLEWISRSLRRIDERLRRLPALGLARPGTLWLSGKPVPARLRRTRQPGVRLLDGTLEAGPGELGSLLERWYRQRAREVLEASIDREAARLGLRPGRVVVRDARTRWGSCSSRGTLSFSWRLLVAPPAVLEYVVVHELCHLVELSHAPRFWAHVERALPGWRTQRAWLREHGDELSAYEPARAFV